MEGEEMKGRKRKDILLNLLPLVSILLFILAWLVVSGGESSLIPTPTAVFERYLKLLEKPISKTSIPGHIWASLKRVLLGLLYGSVFGISFGLLIGWNKTCNRIFKPLFELIRPIPALAWIPLMTLWLGIGETSKVALVFLGTIMPITVNTYTGVRLIPKINIDAARVFGANNVQIITDIVLPSSLSAIIAGVKTALGTAWMVVLAAEMISAKTGLGFMIIRGTDVLDLPLVIFAMILIGVIGACISSLLTIVERKLCPWKSEIN